MTTKRKFKISASLQRHLGEAKSLFLEEALKAFGRILPHLDVTIQSWETPKKDRVYGMTYLTLSFPDYDGDLFLSISKIELNKKKTLERLGNNDEILCNIIVDLIQRGLAGQEDLIGQQLHPEVLTHAFDHLAIAEFLQWYEYGKDGQSPYHFDYFGLIQSLKGLSGLSYENKSIAFGLIIKPVPLDSPPAQSPVDFLKKKKFRLLSDGMKTAYQFSSDGTVNGFISFDETPVKSKKGPHFYPEWAEDMAKNCKDKKIGFILTRQGDILIFFDGSMKITFRNGRWQYWNHMFIQKVLHDNARMVRSVSKATVSTVTNKIYRAAISVSFRRTGGLFVILKNGRTTSKIAYAEDIIGNPSRDDLDEKFDAALGKRRKIQDLSTQVVAELASIDGSMVINNRGELLAYGSVLKSTGYVKKNKAEGSRTKAAISSSAFGLAVKISSDGDIEIYKDRLPLITI